MMKTVVRLTLILFACATLFIAPARADQVVMDPVGDFIPSFDPAAPRAGDLDVVSSKVTLLGQNFTFSGTMNAPIGTTPEAFYVWGVDRGAGASTADFAALDLPDIVFDAVVIIQNEGTGIVIDLAAGTPPTPLAVGAVTVSGNTIEALVPASLLPSRGLAPGQYGWNLWPRWGGIPFSDAQISDFAPDDRNAQVQVVPEPTTMFLLGTGLAGIGGLIRKRRQAKAE